MPELNLIWQGFQAIALVGGGFYFVGRITKNLETLTEVSKDHEGRIRTLEQVPPQQQAS